MTTETRTSTRQTVFVVDDDDGIRRGLKALLTLHEFDVLTFGSAESFLAALPPDLTGCLLLDVRMPGMSGLELQREIRRPSVALPVIIITAHGNVPMAAPPPKAAPGTFTQH